SHRDRTRERAGAKWLTGGVNRPSTDAGRLSFPTIDLLRARDVHQTADRPQPARVVHAQVQLMSARVCHERSDSKRRTALDPAPGSRKGWCVLTTPTPS